MPFLTKPDSTGTRHTICTWCGKTWPLPGHKSSADRAHQRIIRTHHCTEEGKP